MPNDKLVKMLVNVGFDTVAGSVPVLGDVFDVCSSPTAAICNSCWITPVSTMPTLTGDDSHLPTAEVSISNTAALSWTSRRPL